MTIALGLGLGGIALYFAVNPTLSMLYLSDQYAAATTDAQRSAFLAAGEALGPIPLILSYIVIVPSVLWNTLIACGLL